MRSDFIFLVLTRQERRSWRTIMIGHPLRWRTRQIWDSARKVYTSVVNITDSSRSNLERVVLISMLPQESMRTAWRSKDSPDTAFQTSSVLSCPAGRQHMAGCVLTWCVDPPSPRLFLPFRSIHLHFFQNLSRFFFPVLVVANTGSCVGPQNKISHPVGCRFSC